MSLERWRGTRVLGGGLLAVLAALAPDVAWTEAGADRTAALVQGNIEQTRKWDPRHAGSIMQIYAELSMQAARELPDLIVWPETAVPDYWHRTVPYTSRLRDEMAQRDIDLLFGIFVLWTNRTKTEESGESSKTFYDWFLIWEIAAVGVTGLASELLRWLGLPAIGYIVYFCHLVAVMMLFLYLPYTKFAHIAYRTAAMSFEKYRESSFGKPVIETE